MKNRHNIIHFIIFESIYGSMVNTKSVIRGYQKQQIQIISICLFFYLLLFRYRISLVLFS